MLSARIQSDAAFTRAQVPALQILAGINAYPTNAALAKPLAGTSARPTNA